MFMALTIGLCAGFLMNVPIGPLNVCVFNTTLRKGIIPAFMIAMGGCLLDFPYSFCIFSGITLLEFTPSWITGLKSFGILLLFFLGIKELLKDSDDLTTLNAKNQNEMKQNSTIKHDSPPSQEGGFASVKERGLRKSSDQAKQKIKVKGDHPSSYEFDRSSATKGFFLGIVLYVTNPAIIASLSFISVGVKSMNFFEIHIVNNFFFALGIAIGSFLWFSLVVLFVDRFKSKIKPDLLILINQVASVLLLLLASWMAYGLAKEFGVL